MKKTLMKLLYIFIALLIICAVLLILMKVFIKPLDKDGMINYREHELIGVMYSSSGSSTGGYESITLMPDENGELWFDYESMEANGAEIITRHTKVDQTALDEFKTLCRQKELLIMGELKYSELTLLDAPTTTITFVLEKDLVVISSSHELPEHAYGLFSDVYRALMKLSPES
ncbi:MAG: hypothetical protein E7192_08535 [Erysipelotrichaceae bacterium]|nr:hypothetical protein [Erysipelotrichaceae bacterium]